MRERVREVLPAARADQPDVALLDIELPGTDGLATAALLHREMPRCTILMVTTFDRPGYLRRALEAGASGFLAKDAPAEDLVAGACRGPRLRFVPR